MKNERLRVSQALDGDVNNDCHSNQQNLKPNGRHIMPNPKVIVILWGHFYVENSDAKHTVEQLVGDIVSGKFMNGLAQYGVGRGTLADVIVIDTDDSSPAPASLSHPDIQNQLAQWLLSGRVAPAPGPDEKNLLYLVFPPTTTILAPPKSGFCGYHAHGSFLTVGVYNLIWATFRTHKATPTSGDALIRSIAYCISHEMIEAFTDRDGDGYRTENDCEIGDLCEAFGSPSGKATTVSYQGFWVERYWSNWDHGCIHGDSPVRLSTFLKHVSPISPPPPGLRWLDMPKIGLDTIAEKMRSSVP